VVYAADLNATLERLEIDVVRAEDVSAIRNCSGPMASMPTAACGTTSIYLQ
jgi:hypothetical protein